MASKEEDGEEDIENIEVPESVAGQESESPLLDDITQLEGFRGRCQTDTGVIVRLRKNPRLQKNHRSKVVTLLLNNHDLEQDLQGDIRSKLPSVRIRRFTSSRSIKDRRRDLHRISEGRYVRPRPFWERYEDLKNRNRVSFRNVARAVKVSTLERIEIQARKWHKWRMMFKDIRQSVTLFHGTLRQIEGRYGMAIMTYFRFVKWLMFLNFYIMVIMFTILVIPYAALNSSSFDLYVRNITSPELNVTSEEYTMIMRTVNCTQQYIKHIDKIHGPTHSKATLFLDLIQGTGFMERSIMFYGAYKNRTRTDNGQEVVYNVGVAYLCSVFFSLLLSFILIIKNSAKNMKASHGVEKSVAQFTNKVFGGWDYCIKEVKAASHKRNVIGVALVADLADQERTKRLGLRTLVDWLEVWGMRIVINILVVILLCGSLALIGLTTSKMIDESDGEGSSAASNLFFQFVPHLTINLLNLVVPRVFQKLVIFEEYTHEFQIKITLFRSILLRLASPVALMVMLYHKLLLEDDKQKICGNIQWTEDDDPNSVRCWETYVGQQVYKLLLIDIVIVILVVLLWHSPRRYVNTKYRDRSKIVKFIGPQEFDLPKSVVDIIYAQNLCWFGLLFCPLIPAFTLLHNIIVFFVKKFDLFKNCRPESRPYKTSKSTSLFMKVLLLSFMCAVIPVGYVIGKIQPSQSCGPFRMYGDDSYKMYHSLVNNVYSWAKVPQTVFFFIGTGIFVVPLLVLLLLLMYYYWVIGSGYATKKEIAIEDLKMEKMDTKFLLKRINKEKEELLRKDSDC
ncbi:transmembrane channel-like protein 7 [Saccostrea cucullata]|uniref:transmembrane channel-like protein 7 n=1 Tax=Saccostrea cuccullata TaxID=36930 RepID=UPI002ED45C45